MTTQIIKKGDELDYRFKWRDPAAPWLGDGENLVSHTVTVVGPLVVMSSAIEADDVVVWVKPDTSVTPNKLAKLLCQVTTDNSPARKKTAVMEFQVT